ncbi:MAG: TlpA family protein disulfide reductase [Candidatus Manganitrophaceae bacterium]|nr:MAG: TlpA family protein disulfide reductase [Candidatus Manganitrophaceae bacterium]
MKRRLSWMMVLLIGLIACGGIDAGAGGPKVPAFELLSLDGKKYTDKDLLEKPTLLVFWASWCGTCQHELPKVHNLMEKMKGKPFQIIAIGFKDSEANIRGYVKSHPDTFNFPVLYDPGDRVAARLGAQFTPTLFLLNKKGELVLHHFSGGFFERRDFQEAVQQLLKET